MSAKSMDNYINNFEDFIIEKQNQTKPNQTVPENDTEIVEILQ